MKDEVLEWRKRFGGGSPTVWKSQKMRKEMGQSARVVGHFVDKYQQGW